MPLPDHELSLIVDGKRFGGWLDVRVTRGIERASADFAIKATQRWPGQDERFEVPEGSKCEIRIGDDLVMTGYVDVIDIDRDQDNAAIEIAGRSKTCDLVDCSPPFDMTELAGLDLAAVARRVAKPFGVEVVAKDTGPVFAVAAAHHGETAWKLIERLARQRQILVMDDEQGRLVLARLATERSTDEIVHPSDALKKLKTRRDASKRFSEYVVKAQAGRRWLGGTSDGSQGDVASALAHVEGAAHDTGVTRYRPKTVLSEGAAKKEGAMARAEWEARRNKGQALGFTALRVGWRQSDKKLWVPNLLVPCKAPLMKLEAELALSEVTYRKGAEGTLCEMSLAPPDAFTPEPPEAPAQAGGDVGNRWARAGDGQVGGGGQG